jgi:DNA-binding transcriptional ArsR family regulator
MPRRAQLPPLRSSSISGIAAVLADPSRAAMLDTLLDGDAHSIGALARRAGVSAATASSHLRRLGDAKLVTIEAVGRERHVRLAGADVAEVLERIAALAEPRATGTAIDQLRFARTCYDHLAGLLGVALAERLVERGWLYRTSDTLEPSSALLAWLARHGHPVSDDERRPLSRACVDWTERTPHVAGRVGAALASLALADAWVTRVRTSRALRLTSRGRRVLADELGLVLVQRPPRSTLVP